MNFKAQGVMRSKPSIKSKIRMDPLQFDTSASGSFDCEVSRISAYIGEIGVRFAIPFMKPRRKLPMIASVGGFKIRLNPFQLRSKGIGLHVKGILGTKGSAAEMDMDVSCETEMEVAGKVPIKVGRIQMDLCEVDELA